MDKKEILQEEDFYLDITNETIVYDGFAENAGRPDDKKMKVYIKPFSGRDLYFIQSKVKSELRKYLQDNPDADFGQMYEFYNDKWNFITRIEKIENFFYKDNEEEGIKEFKTAEELFNYPSTATFNLVSELFIYFAKIDRLNLKN